ncbi:MAG: dienelactone hydrolase family protein [Deltaproteobacteria bacterium]|nr:dienelactone hydrolase family protein [Deltaproteobacteria bacterium]
MKPRYVQTLIAILVVGFFVCFYAPGCMAQGELLRSTNPGAGTHSFTLTVGGLERTYIVHVPSSYNPQKQLSAVVIMFHGGGGTARAAMWETGWAEKAEKTGFLAVFPNAMSRDPAQPSSFARNPQLWNDGSDRFYPNRKAPDDVLFIHAMLDDLLPRFGADARRVFVTGFSNGASMSFRVGAELSKRIAAIAPVAGACWLEPLTLERPVPMYYITGTDDPLNLIEGGVPKLLSGGNDKVRAKPKPPVRDSIRKWAKALGCPTAPASTSEMNGVHTETYGPGSNGAEVIYVTVSGLGHTWAGGKSLLPESLVGKTSDKIKATDVIWDFFEKHPMK